MLFLSWNVALFSCYWSQYTVFLFCWCEQINTMNVSCHFVLTPRNFTNCLLQVIWKEGARRKTNYLTCRSASAAVAIILGRWIYMYVHKQVFLSTRWTTDSAWVIVIEIDPSSFSFANKLHALYICKYVWEIWLRQNFME